MPPPLPYTYVLLLSALMKKLPSLEEVRIHQNPFQCTCRWLREAEANIPKVTTTISRLSKIPTLLSCSN
jgi:hypothetical protein